MIQERWFRTFFCSRLKNDSIAELSPQETTGPMDPTIRNRASARMNFQLRPVEYGLRSSIALHQSWFGLSAVNLFLVRPFISTTVQRSLGDRGSVFLTIAVSFLPQHAPPRVVTAYPPRSPVRHRLTGITGLVDQEPMPKLWVITVGITVCIK